MYALLSETTLASKKTSYSEKVAVITKESTFAKGQLILKCSNGVFKSNKKTTICFKEFLPHSGTCRYQKSKSKSLKAII